MTIDPAAHSAAGHDNSHDDPHDHDDSHDHDGPQADAVLGPLDATLSSEREVRRYLAEGFLPMRRSDDDSVLVAAADRGADAAFRMALQVEFDARVDIVDVDCCQLQPAIIRTFSHKIARAAANDLHERDPMLSAKSVLTRRQAVGGAVLLVAFLACLILWPRTTFVTGFGVASVLFLLGTGFKFLVAVEGARFDLVERISAEEVAALRNDDLPRYTVLVPVFREANIVPQLVENLGGLEYPVDKLEVLILTEEEDQETRDAVALADPPPHFHVVTVPAGQPQTKPRACNVGLMLATGDCLVIYDAEDTPDADQLNKAVIAFERGGEEIVCVQAALNYFNSTENVLTRMFTLEYSYWFDYMLAGLDHAGLPIPLGGTSNHFRTQALLELGGWDPHNVTEDADLGIRASALGYRVGVINSTTMEEANTSIPNFVRQRSRWIKGYMQTTLVHARRPVQLIREVGLRSFLGFVLLIAGTPVTFLCVLPFYLLSAASIVLPSTVLGSLFPGWLLWLCLFNFLIGNGIVIYLSMMGPYKRGTFNLVLWALLNPAYWLLHTIAAYKALWQLAVRPHYWEKTEHGLTTQHSPRAGAGARRAGHGRRRTRASESSPEPPHRS